MNMGEFLEECDWDMEVAVRRLAQLLDEANAEIERLRDNMLDEGHI